MVIIYISGEDLFYYNNYSKFKDSENFIIIFPMLL